MENHLTRNLSNQRLSTTREGAETLAVSALAFLAAEPARLGRFLSMTGLGPETLRRAASAPGFHASVLNYLAADEPLLIAFASGQSIEPSRVKSALGMLEGRPVDPDP